MISLRLRKNIKLFLQYLKYFSKHQFENEFQFKVNNLILEMQTKKSFPMMSQRAVFIRNRFKKDLCCCS